MRVVLQRVSSASVAIAGEEVGSIERGLLLLVGFTHDDTTNELEWMADKVIGLRIFPDESGKMNVSLNDHGGGVLIVSQFTVYGDTRKGRRPSFIKAAPPDVSVPLYERFVELLRSRVAGTVATGRFGAAMDVGLVNDGPVTLVLERSATPVAKDGEAS